MLNLALFISGSGSTACAIIKACRENVLKIKPVLVVASKRGILGIERVRQTGFSPQNIVVLNPKNFSNSDSFAEKLLSVCLKKKVDLIGQYGWLPLTPNKLIANYSGKIINQHPGPLDKSGIDFGGKGMYGKRVHTAVLYFRRVTNHDFWTECTTHYVTDQFDRGDIIKSKKIKIRAADTVEDLQKRVLPVEHQAQIAALKDFASGKVKIIKRKIPLIRKNEIKILNEAKKVASILYPNG